MKGATTSKNTAEGRGENGGDTISDTAEDERVQQNQHSEVAAAAAAEAAEAAEAEAAAAEAAEAEAEAAEAAASEARVEKAVQAVLKQKEMCRREKLKKAQEETRKLAVQETQEAEQPEQKHPPNTHVPSSLDSADALDSGGGYWGPWFRRQARVRARDAVEEETAPQTLRPILQSGKSISTNISNRFGQETTEEAEASEERIKSPGFSQFYRKKPHHGIVESSEW
jgi:hypothetical protein